MKFKSTKKIAVPGEFPPFKITVETQGEAELLTALIGRTDGNVDEAFGITDGYANYTLLLKHRGHLDRVYPRLEVSMIDEARTVDGVDLVYRGEI